MKWFSVMVMLLALQSPSFSMLISDQEDASGNYSASMNTSSISFTEQRNISSASVAMNIGKGYYGSRPISYSSLVGSETWIKDTSSAASMRHEANYAHGIDGTIQLSGQDSSYRWNGHSGDDRYSQSTGAIAMKVNEDITEGRVSIAVLQGESVSGQEIGARDGSDPLINAWKNPSLEMEEEYIGTYHIEKNLSISTGNIDAWNGGYWLGCCSDSDGKFSLGGYSCRTISADDVFDYHSASV
jgi:hypothetical protein